MTQTKKHFPIYKGIKVHNSSNLLLRPTNRVTNFNSDIFPFGDDNLFPQLTAQLGRESVNHRSIINNKLYYTTGKDLFSNDYNTDSIIKKLKLYDTFKKIVLDYYMGGNAFIEVISSPTSKYFNINHLDYTTCRVSSNRNFVVLSPDWKSDRGRKDPNRKYIGLYPNVTTDLEGYIHTVHHIKDYEPEFVNYGIPNWYSALYSALISKKTNEWNHSRLDNEFSISGLMIVPGVDSPEDAQYLDDKFKEYKSSKNPGKLLTHYTRGLGVGEQRDEPKLINFNQNQEGNWLSLHERSDQDLVMAHNWFYSLAGISQNTGFDTDRILNDYSVAMSTVIAGMQTMFLNIFISIFSTYGIYGEIKILNESPIDTTKDIKFIYELREEAGLTFDKADPEQNKLYITVKK